MEDKIERLVDAVKDYLFCEIKSTIDDYKLLENMNEVTAKKYRSMKPKCDQVNQAHKTLKDKYECLSGYFAQIDNLEKKIDALEEMAYSIDGYTKKLENQFKRLES